MFCAGFLSALRINASVHSQDHGLQAIFVIFFHLFSIYFVHNEQCFQFDERSHKHTMIQYEWEWLWNYTFTYLSVNGKVFHAQTHIHLFVQKFNSFRILTLTHTHTLSLTHILLCLMSLSLPISLAVCELYHRRLSISFHTYIVFRLILHVYHIYFILRFFSGDISLAEISRERVRILRKYA